MDHRLQEARRLFSTGEIETQEMFRIAVRSGLTGREAALEVVSDLDDLPGCRYTSNNSGGSWWLTDQNWKDLEQAGWLVEWSTDWEGPAGVSVRDERFLGALADRAIAPFMGREEAMASFQKVTDQDPYAAGCECCGPPHSFLGR